MSAAPTFRESAATAEAAQAGLLYERYARQLHAFCRARLPSPEEAEDAVQHTFLNAYRSLRGGTVPRAEAAWMYAIAANVCRERSRSAWRRSRIEVVSDDGLVGDRAAPEHSHEELTGLAEALGELTENQRRAILLREWQGLSYREIATELALTEGAVETLLFRARRSLSGKLDRSRGRIWGVSNLGSAFAWAKAVLGGAAATLVVTAGLTAAGPVQSHPSHHAQVVALEQAPAKQAPAPRRAPVAPPRLRPTLRPASHATVRNATAVVAPTPSAPVRAPAPVTRQPAPLAGVPPPPVAAAPPPPAPVVPQPPKLAVPQVPPLPPAPPLPPVTVPSVPLPDLPKLPQLP